MKRSFILIILLPLIAMISCSKEENAMPAAADPQLKAPKCTPNVMNYEDEFYFLPAFPPICFEEMIFWQPAQAINKGRLVVAASCRFNDKGSMTIIFEGLGIQTEHIYKATYYGDYHFIGSLTGQGAQVTRIVQDAVFENLSTGEFYTLSFNLHQTINANGEITVDYVEYIPCE